ncbi:MAG: hypothetical protein AAGH60_15025 [Pseudomonadota bacterium]
MPDKLCVFVSSSSDVWASRGEIDKRLRAWFEQAGLADAVEPYLWEKDLEGGSLLSDRQPTQLQIPDPMDGSIPFTICIFGERCGVPLSDELPPNWCDRLKEWRATHDRPGLQHPWPKEAEEQAAQLERGNFPLTGTVFELISACAVNEEYRNLIIGYSANKNVQFVVSHSDVDFNAQKEKDRITEPGQSDNDRRKLEAEQYTPQVHALFNLLAYLAERQNLPCYGSEEEMTKEVIRRAERELRKHFNVESENNPFKMSLTHFGVDDTNEVPGRKPQINRALGYMDSPGAAALVLITGSSGCGKSSILQRGVLGKLQQRGARVLAVRPSDLDDVEQRDRLDVLWDMICERIDGCYIPRLPKPMRDEKMAEQLKQVLEERGQDLVLGLDQFEEMLDEMQLFSEPLDRDRGWWLMLRFLQKIAVSPRVNIFATLESSREATFKELNIEAAIGLPWETVSADVDADTIETIAVDGFDRGGFALDAPLRREIKQKWSAFSKNPGTATGNASLLPLAALWMAQLYEKFEDQAAQPVTSGTALMDALEGATLEKPVLRLAEIGGENAVNFEGVIGRLADDAWYDAMGEAPPSGPVEENRVAYGGLCALFDTLIALDDGGHMRLLSAPRLGPGKYFERIFNRFVDQRLMVPTGREGRVRLVHQAIVDHWGPAKAWYAWREEYLKLEQKMRDKALAWDRDGRPHLDVDQDLAQAAGQVLDANKGEWPGQDLSQMSKYAAALRAYCLEALSQATDLSKVIDTSLAANTLAHAAAGYQLTDAVMGFLQRSPEMMFLSNNSKLTLLKSAAVVDGELLPRLIELASKRNKLEWAKEPTDNGWHPIARAIQEGANKNFEALLPLYDDPNQTVVEAGLTLLGVAAMADNPAAAQILLERLDVDPKLGILPNIPAINVAAYWGSAEVFNLLLSRWETPTEGEIHPLQEAAYYGRVNIIRLLMNSDQISDDQRMAALRHLARPHWNTPLMEAALGRGPDALAELLQHCDPTDEVHRLDEGQTLFHLALARPNEGSPTADEQRRALKCVELLVKTDLDPMLLADGKTALEIGGAFPQAQRVLRKHMLFDYGSMSDNLKKQDLTSSNPKDYRRLLQGAPQVLRDKINGKSGLDILIEAKKTDAISFALESVDAAMPIIRRKWAELIGLASETGNIALQNAILDKLPNTSKVNLSVMLDAAIRDPSARSTEVADRLRARRVRLTIGAGNLGMTAFHHLARGGDLNRFAALAQGQDYKLPLDDWGRAPSDLAAPKLAAEIAELQATHFIGKPTRWKHGADQAPYLLVEHEPGPKVSPQMRRRVLTLLRQMPELPKADGRKTRIRAFKAPFYRGTNLIVATNSEWESGKLQICYLQRGTELILLPGTSPPIHEFNAKFKTKITARQARSYLAFFCFFVRGEDGPFLIVDRPGNAFVPPEIGRSEHIDVCPPIQLWGVDDRGYIRASASVYYANALFVADFLIHPGGMVEMVDDQAVAANLKYRVFAPLAAREP